MGRKFVFVLIIFAWELTYAYPDFTCYTSCENLHSRFTLNNISLFWCKLQIPDLKRRLSPFPTHNYTGTTQTDIKKVSWIGKFPNSSSIRPRKFFINYDLSFPIIFYIMPILKFTLQITFQQFQHILYHTYFEALLKVCIKGEGIWVNRSVGHLGIDVFVQRVPFG